MRIKGVGVLMLIALLLLISTVIVGKEFINIQSEYELVQSENKLIQSENEKMKQQIDNVFAEKQLQEKQYKERLNVERLKAYTEIQSEEPNDTTGYLLWENALEVANHVVEDSGGRFKKDWGIFLGIEASKKGIDPFLIYELLRVETGGTFNPNTIGPQTKYGRAYGLAQFMKNTSPWIAEMADLPYNHDNLFDPLYSIQLAITYLDFLYKQYGDWDHALTAYHRGIYGLQSYIEANGNAKSWYAVEIQENAEDRKLVATSN